MTGIRSLEEIKYIFENLNKAARNENKNDKVWIIIINCGLVEFIYNLYYIMLSEFRLKDIKLAEVNIQQLYQM